MSQTTQPNIKFGVGIDISAYKFNVCIISDDFEVLWKDELITNATNLLKLVSVINQTQKDLLKHAPKHRPKASVKVVPHIVFEATGVYSKTFIRLFCKQGLDFYCINPLLAHKMVTNLRQNKTDRTDARKLAQIALKEYHTSFVRTKVYAELLDLDRWYEEVNEDTVRAKNRFHRCLRQTFPVELSVDKDRDLYYELISVFSHADWVTNKTPQQVAKRLEKDLGSVHPRIQWLKYANELSLLAKEAAPGVDSDSAVVEQLQYVAKEVVALIKKKAEILEQMTTLAETLPEHELFSSIPGISTDSAARIIAELGDIRRFNGNDSKLNAFIGIDIRHSESGKWVGNDHISKRGNPIARKLFYNVILHIVMTCRKTKYRCHIADIYDRKELIRKDEAKKSNQSEAKQKQPSTSKKTVITCTHKLIRTLLGLVHSEKPYDYTRHAARFAA